MEIYLVGGAVRDKLLLREVHERDYVVVKATPLEMLEQGFKPVGRDFPVFLHPKTHEEYALARTERKTGKGHQGFLFHASPSVSLREDLMRRDLTINAMAEDNNGDLIDPYHGEADLKARVLRHVSSAFSEDPLRVLRVARLMAQLAEYHFTVAPETLDLMCDMVKKNTLSELSHERVWQEIFKSLHTSAPEQFFLTLGACGALAHFFPHLTDRGIHALKVVTTLTPSPDARIAALTFEGKFTLSLPATFFDLCELTRRLQAAYTAITKEDSAAIVAFIKHSDAIRRSDRFGELLIACEAIHGLPNIEKKWLRLLSGLKQIDSSALSKIHTGKDLPEAIAAARLRVVADFVKKQ